MVFKKYLGVVVILFASLACDRLSKKANSTGVGKTVLDTVEETLSIEKKYVNTRTRLNYRKSPKGKVLGKLSRNQEVIVVEHTGVFQEIKDDNQTKKGEWVGVLNKNDTVYVFDAFLSSIKSENSPRMTKYVGVWSKFKMRKTPLADTTNFDNITKGTPLNAEEIKELQLRKVYKDLAEHPSYAFYPSYRLNLGAFNTIVVNVFKGEHELESILMTYDTSNNLLNVWNDKNDKHRSDKAVVIAYDEIAESWSRTSSSIKNNCVTIVEALYTEPPVIDTLLYHVNIFGDINKVNTHFKNNIRPDKTIRLHKTYTDTIQFVQYNDNYDHLYLEGNKGGKDIRLIYNWDWSQKKYNFQKGDQIKIQWKMDSIYIAGEGEMLKFHEVLKDVEKL